MKSKRRHKQTAVPHSLTERHSLAFTAKFEASRIPQQTDLETLPNSLIYPSPKMAGEKGSTSTQFEEKGLHRRPLTQTRSALGLTSQYRVTQRTINSDEAKDRDQIRSGLHVIENWERRSVLMDCLLLKCFWVKSSSPQSKQQTGRRNVLQRWTTGHLVQRQECRRLA